MFQYEKRGWKYLSFEMKSKGGMENEEVLHETERYKTGMLDLRSFRK
jgi:hypothetical protein